ncbi:MAG: hypothetical protein A2018_00770 [Alphaproteobacteria bacterium GWF2_58_20]|nr:MAG: hypothetical protein A2018_00770 [Alphaproteobacteria bacterium GWF2_58_20]
MAIATATHAASMDNKDTAILMALDKVTARSTRLAIPVGTQTGYKTLRITVRACQKSTPLEAPESAAFVEIAELHDLDQASTLFSGWMFASSPALSAMDHPVYDIWVLDCTGKTLPADLPINLP